MIPEEVIQRIKDENDIVDVISETIVLKKSGSNYTGLCPFHSEKSPSFFVSPSKQIYKCFGCGEAGNAISFVMQTRNISFPEACRYLADKANIPWDFDQKQDDSASKRKKRLFYINREAAKFFFVNLRNRAPQAKEYFLNRGITEDTINKFGLGYALDSWNALRDYLKTKGISEKEMLDLGLIIKSEKGTTYDRFRNRVMFPVFDIKGNIIGFGGRVLGDAKPKYLNSPETEVFKKGTNLYGANLAIKDIPNRQMIMVEGYMDCIALYQGGITNVVASLGTALTQQQARTLKRHVDEIAISFDSDSAGQKAALRGIKVLEEEGFEVKVISIPQGKDPDDYIKANGKEAYLKLVDNATDITEFRLNKAKEENNIKQKQGLVKYLNEVSSIIKELDPIERDYYVTKVASSTGINEKVIYDKLQHDTRNTNKNSRNMNENTRISQELYLEPVYIKAERNLLRLMLERDWYNYISERITPQDFIGDINRKIFDNVIKAYDSQAENIRGYIEIKCEDGLMNREFTKVVDRDIDLSESDRVKQFIDRCINEIKRQSLEEKRKEIHSKIRKFEAQGEIEECIKLIEELKKVEADLSH